jgi:hypothetical protein
MEAESSTLFLLTIFLMMASCHAIRRRSAFDQSRKSCFAESTDVWLQAANCRARLSDFPTKPNLFWAISETLYPSRLISFPTKPSLCPTSPKRRVLATPKTLRTEVIREQRSKTQRHRSTLGQRCDPGQKEPVGSQGDRIAHVSRRVPTARSVVRPGRYQPSRGSGRSASPNATWR